MPTHAARRRNPARAGVPRLPLRTSDVRHSFRSREGQDIDCIDFSAQPGVKALAAKGHPVVASLPAIPAEIQARLGDSQIAEERAVHVGFEGDLDPNGHARACPEGSVPQVRITAAQVQRAGGVDAFRRVVHGKRGLPNSLPLAKASPPDVSGGYCGPDGPGYNHVYASLLTPATGSVVAGSSTMAIYDPAIPLLNLDDFSTYVHSIAQTWTLGYAQTGLLETVEAGWNIDEWLYEDDAPTGQTHLFIYSTVDNYNITGCYNDWDWTAQCGETDDAGNCIEGGCVPWVQVSKQYVPGMTLPASAVEAVNPRKPATFPKELSLTTVSLEGNWWILAQVAGGPPSLLGYYAGSEVNGPMLGFEAGGEVASGTGEFANTPMGSGLPPTEGQGLAAYHRNYFALMQGAGEDAGSPLVTDAFVCSTQLPQYAYATPKPVVQAGLPWVNYFFYGGDPTTPVSPPPQDGQ